jgi:hypothetical protein
MNRILLFYIGSLVVLLALYPWVEVKSDSSPFVMIFHGMLFSGFCASAAVMPISSSPPKENMITASDRIRLRWWCCWRSTRGWRSNPTVARS